MICFAQRYLFVHIPKTAGTSLKQRLAGYDLERRGPADPAATPHLYSHRSAAALDAELVKAVGAEAAAGYFRFAFVRNPWDRLLSAFLYLDHGGSGRVQELPRVAAVKPYRGDFRRFVLEGLEDLLDVVPQLRPQYRWSHDDPARPLDFIGRFEHLERDFALIAPRLGQTVGAPLPHLRAGGHRPYTEYYDDDSRALVGRVYARDIVLFDYRFGA